MERPGDETGLSELVERLERIRIEACADPLRIAALLEERQSILTRIQHSDAHTLDPETRTALCLRIRRVKERDAMVLAHLRDRAEELEQKVDPVLDGRRAARGYRSSEVATKRGGGRLA